MKDIRKEKAMNARVPASDTAGMENQYELKPAKTKFVNVKPGTIRVTRYKVIAYVTHLKSPKVTRFRGRSRRLRIGRTIIVVKDRTAPVKNKVSSPFAKTMPLTP